MIKKKIIIGSRGSKLALIYAENVKKKILNNSDLRDDQIIIKGITTKKNTNTHPPPPDTSFMASFILIVIIKAIDAEMIEITPRTLEAIVLEEYLFVVIGGRTSFERITKI